MSISMIKYFEDYENAVAVDLLKYLSLWDDKVTPPFYTGVGSRDTPPEILTMMMLIGFKMAESGYILRSGGAKGADSYFYYGAIQWLMKTVPTGKDFANIYLPYNGFNRNTKDDLSDAFSVFTDYPLHEAAVHLASKIHPAWDRCSDFAQKAHGRNCFQVLGHELNKPSRILFCWAPPLSNGEVKGGTATAWKLAGIVGIKRINLAIREEFLRTLEWLEIDEIKLKQISGVST